MQFLLSAGEASADTYGAQLIQALRQLAPNASFFGMGGTKMQSAGCDLQVHASEVSVVGLAEVVTHLPAIRQRFKSLLAAAARRKPDAAVLIDFPDFNLRLARELHKLGIAVFYFVSPQVWAWRTGRVKQIKKYVRKMIVIFPFEQEFYRRHGVEVTYVGHPLAHLSDPDIAREEFAVRHGLNAGKQWIALLPGSRRKEVRLNLPAMIRAAQLLQKDGDQFEFMLPLASTLDKGWMLSQLAGAQLPVHITDGARATMMLSRASIVASGTATVEAALSGTPFVVVYRLSPLTWIMGRRLVSLNTFAMANLIAEKKVVPELIQADFTPEAVLRELQRIIPEGAARSQMQHDLIEVRRRLHDSENAEAPALRAARAIVSEI
ncbi:MAG: lipid-A-disaccharide synthase [Candidatus Angelobacter sp.]